MSKVRLSQVVHYTVFLMAQGVIEGAPAVSHCPRRRALMLVTMGDEEQQSGRAARLMSRVSDSEHPWVKISQRVCVYMWKLCAAGLWWKLINSSLRMRLHLFD